MICPQGSIILIEKFVFRNGTSKDKFFIVLDNSKDNELSLLGMSTSNESGFYFDIEQIDISHGAITDANGKIMMYCMPKTVVVGIKNGFKFSKDTFFLAKYCFSELDCEQMYKYNIVIKDEISKDELNNLVYTLYKSPYIKPENKIKLDPILAALNP